MTYTASRGSLHSEQGNKSLLYPIGDAKISIADEAQMRSLDEGSWATCSHAIESEEATAKSRSTSRRWQQDRGAAVLSRAIGLYGNYCHGTHVAGIAAAGNPYCASSGRSH
jgi:hypothetical protein